MSKESLIASPIRIQRKRTKGWRMPANTVYVGRGTRWGNPFIVGEHARTPEKAVALYQQMLVPYSHHGPRSSLEDFMISAVMLEEIQEELRGKNLACFCALDQCCHADFLLKIANDEEEYHVHDTRAGAIHNR